MRKLLNMVWVLKNDHLSLFSWVCTFTIDHMYVVHCILLAIFSYILCPKYQLWYDLLWFTMIHWSVTNYSHHSTCINVCCISICNIIPLHLLLLSYLDSFCLKNIYFSFTFCVILGMMQASTWICVSCDKVFFSCHIYLVGIRITCWPYLWVYLWKSISSHLTRTSSSHMVEKLLISARGHWDWGLWWQFRSIGWPFCDIAVNLLISLSLTSAASSSAKASLIMWEAEQVE